MSSFGTFRFSQTGNLFGSPQVPAEVMTAARAIMGRFQSPLNVNKDTEDTLQFRWILALARGIYTMQAEAKATYYDNFLSTSRAEHIEAVWGTLLKVPYDNTRTLAENIEFYQGLVKILLTGSEFLGNVYDGTAPVNIIVAVYLFTQITGVRLYETWRDQLEMF